MTCPASGSAISSQPAAPSPFWISAAAESYITQGKIFPEWPKYHDGLQQGYKAQLFSLLLCHVNSRASYGVEYGFVGLRDPSLFSSMLSSSFHKYGFLITLNQYLACHTPFHHLLPQNLNCDRWFSKIFLLTFYSRETNYNMPACYKLNVSFKCNSFRLSMKCTMFEKWQILSDSGRAFEDYFLWVAE